MPRPLARRPEQLDLPTPPAGRPPRSARGRETPEQIAKRLTGRRPSPPGIPDRAELTLKISLPRALVERLTAQAIREERRLEQVITEIIQGTR